MEAAGSSGATPKDIDYGSITDFVNMVELYRGRHSVVWRCTCKRSRQPLVVKGYVKEKMRERHYGQVAREVVLMQKCRPAGIVRFAGSFEDDRVIYIVQEDCSKGDLFQLMNACGGRMAEKDVVRKVITPLLQSLEVLHEINVLHRDIKPENIFFATDGTMRLGDFGLAICTNSERPKSRVGTLDYMAPEVISLPNHEEREAVEKKHGMQNVSYYNAKVDIWSVGILAYELIVGRPPFEVEGERETALRIMFDENIEFPNGMSEQSIHFIKLALTKSASKRPSATQMLAHPWVVPYSGAAAADRGNTSNEVEWSGAAAPEASSPSKTRSMRPSMGKLKSFFSNKFGNK
mmetsp:Transcript_30663/g.78746  ORF Transcript_30663/g.78746 Transcript_30663/m.78746 type:complete len:348 (+) Transcript_30663:231-1274(+)